MKIIITENNDRNRKENNHSFKMTIITEKEIISYTKL